MSAIKLHIIKPSVNNMTARVFVRAAKLDFTEDDVYGKTRSPEFMGRNPAHLTPMMEAPGLPKGVMWESCAILQYLCNKHHLDQFYPAEPEKRAMVDSAMFYVVGTLYPYIVRATYGALGFPQYPGEVGASDATPAEKEKAQKAAAEAGSTITFADSMEEAFEGADVVYPKSWGRLDAFTDESKALAESGAYANWICDEQKLALASDDVLYLHCLPADRGREVTDAVMDGPHSVIWDEAENRMHTGKALMALTMGGYGTV